MKQYIAKNKNKILFWIILLVGALFRLLLLGQVPGGVHPDEAFAGYEAYSIIHYGVDSWGYRLPVYFVSWGSGMNVLESYFMIPFVALFGLNEITIRLPQVIMAIVSIVVIYKLVKLVANEKLALVAMFVMAISPWHFMFSRWGCESNMCPSMILLGTYFLILSMKRIIEKKSSIRTMALSGLFWGLDLYCYAATWILVASILLIWLVYFLLYCNNHKIKLEKNDFIGMIVFAIILFVMALPLLLFILINMGFINEIRSFISIPKMVVFRSDEIMDISSLKNRIHYFAHILVAGEDGRIWNSIKPFGLFYTKASIVVVVIGVVYGIIKAFKDIKAKKLSYAFMLFCYTSVATILVIVQRVDIISSNYLQVALLIYWALGIYAFSGLAKEWLLRGLIIAYTIGFVLFLNIYFGEFAKNINEKQMAGARDAIIAAENLFVEKNADKIYVCDGISHANMLFYTKYPVTEYIDTVEWKEYPDRYLSAKSFGRYYWYEEDLEDTDNVLLNRSAIYIVNEDSLDIFDDSWEIVRYNNAYVAYAY